MTLLDTDPTGVRLSAIHYILATMGTAIILMMIIMLVIQSRRRTSKTELKVENVIGRESFIGHQPPQENDFEEPPLPVEDAEAAKDAEDAEDAENAEEAEEDTGCIGPEEQFLRSLQETQEKETVIGIDADDTLRTYANVCDVHSRLPSRKPANFVDICSQSGPVGLGVMRPRFDRFGRFIDLRVASGAAQAQPMQVTESAVPDAVYTAAPLRQDLPLDFNCQRPWWQCSAPAINPSFRENHH